MSISRRVITPLLLSRTTPTIRPAARLAAITAPLLRPLHNTPHALKNMRCVLIKDGKGPVENIYLGEEPTPSPKKGEALVKIETFGLNRMDLLQREGKYNLPPQASKTVLGVEFAGTITELGEGGSKFKVGDEVFGLAFGGAYAEYIASPESMLLPKPKELNWVQAAALPENWMTAYQALFLETGLKEGENALIHAGASGVGVAAIQLALQTGKAGKVFTTCGSDEKVAFLKNLVDNDPRLIVINYRTQDFEEEIKKHDTGIDVIVDFIGKDYFQRNLSVMRRDGRMVLLAFMSGAVVDKANIAMFLGKRLQLRGSTLRSRTVEYQANLLQQFKEHALPLIVSGKYKVEVYKTYPWTEVIEGQKEMAANKNSGKIVFEITK
ncbi:uncharacterized protein CcaverHIS019_0608540 [Cutaneotrichosporon cavernicola]|uniref:Enoyl reductase (ER) domain-containing protein n=1 Tax=Cutaneotrichosporon cavernicola TaxID=279322 RepID=A0AA48QYK8_9TREE|nr:uncharacterized protein CcaverHIS019_0608540 [Cutaneotrichosporon cavernicola]BEI94395.1 hypothetical protein CcaverHIS019_0608540 [Cutaneotrichosporon cavernicola]BEJ02172.1 hypothetical protein CcaverHIS631_0608540 [Cutaneotrichosporon cavernicola]BEJ09933.1 hypothetical protein CcaverHIS641_0608480 [Cutaneotrichosporon cavernicola]